MRKERDIVGEKNISKDVLYGIHSLRANENFPNDLRFHVEWYRAMGQVKLAVYLCYIDFAKEIRQKYKTDSPIKLMSEEIIEALCLSASEISEGKYFDSFIVPAISGGAGTSINMNINEIVANSSLLKLDDVSGNYDKIDPFEHANVFQSTNDVVPTALKLAVMKLLTELEESINCLRKDIEIKERDYSSTPRIAYTQMQEAVPSTFGRLFSTYNEALSRDWWRVSKCFERIKVVNLGGGAIGTGLAVPKYFVMEVVRKLQEITSLPITRGENLSDVTTNLDSLVEVHAILKAHAVNIEKMLGDIRLLAADISVSDVKIPVVQTGSSMMPGKVNPVIAEYGISVAHKIYANDNLIAQLSAQGCLDLNAYVPTIGHALIESLKLLISVNKTVREKLFSGLCIDKSLAEQRFKSSPSVTTALIPYIGYKQASLLAVEMKERGVDIFEANRSLQIIAEDKITEILHSGNVLKGGYSLSDL